MSRVETTKPKKDGEPPQGGKLVVKDRRWWAQDIDDLERARRVLGVAGELWRDAAPDREQMWRNARLYGNMPILGLTPRLYRRRAPASRWNRLSLNVIKSVSDTFVALVTKDRPKVTFATNGATWETHRKAENLEKFCDGIFYEANIYEETPRIMLDACIFMNYGIVKPHIDDSDPKKPKIAITRVLPWEVLTDPIEAFYGNPKTFYQIAFVDRMQLKAEYPDLAARLETANSGGFDDATAGAGGAIDDLCVVVEAWRVPTSKTSGDGYHALVCGDVLLENENGKKYKRTQNPFEFYYRSKPVLGITGESLACELSGIQLEINVLLDKIRRSFHLLAVGHWLIENGSEIISNQLTNEIGSIIRYSGTQPTFVSPDAVSVQVFQHLDRLYSRAFEIVGINQMSAQSQKPPGLNSGKAMLVYADVQSQRFQPSYREYQYFFLRLARQCISLAREIGETNKNFIARSEGKDIFSAVKWADAQLDDDEFIVKMKPTNALADDPAAAQQMVADMLSGGLLSPAEGKRMLGSSSPDWEQYFKDFNASYDLTMQMLGRIRDGQEFSPPLPFQSTEEALQLANNFYLREELLGAPKKVLENLRRWIVRCQFNQKAAAPPPQLPPPQGGPPVPAMLPPNGAPPPPVPNGPPPPLPQPKAA